MGKYDLTEQVPNQITDFGFFLSSKSDTLLPIISCWVASERNMHVPVSKADRHVGDAIYTQPSMQDFEVRCGGCHLRPSLSVNYLQHYSGTDDSFLCETVRTKLNVCRIAVDFWIGGQSLTNSIVFWIHNKPPDRSLRSWRATSKRDKMYDFCGSRHELIRLW